MEYTTNGQGNSKEGMSLSSKIILAIIFCIIAIIALLIVLLINLNKTPFTIYINGEASAAANSNTLLTEINNVTYFNIEEFSKLVGYEYHKGEYKASTIEDNKCYVQGKEETASFYLNDNTVYKLLVNDLDKEYEKHSFENEVINKNGAMYAPIEAISNAFNVLMKENNTDLKIYSLDYLTTFYNKKVVEWGYTGISKLNFENQKAILYRYLIVQKEGGLYKIIDVNNTKEIVLDRYIAIQFSENMQEFYVVNSLNKAGIINLDGTTKIEPIYESISVFDKQEDLYIIKTNGKYGVIKGNNITVVYPEYEKIGFDIGTTITNTSNNKKMILDTLIPVYKDGKWGAYNKNAKLVLGLEYDSFGYSLNSVVINGQKKAVKPVLSIEECNGVVVRQGEKYGVIDVNGKLLAATVFDAVYKTREESNNQQNYLILYGDNELNLIQELISAGLIENQNKEDITDINNTTIKNELKQETQNTLNNQM